MASSFATCTAADVPNVDNSAWDDDAWQGAPDESDLAVMAAELSCETLDTATESQLLILFPLILQRIASCHASHVSSPLEEPLRHRLCASRRLKLRFLLLRTHPAYSALLCKLRYSSRAYDGVPVVPTACSSSKVDLMREPEPRGLLLSVDMVGKVYIFPSVLPFSTTPHLTLRAAATRARMRLLCARGTKN